MSPGLFPIFISYVSVGLCILHPQTHARVLQELTLIYVFAVRCCAILTTFASLSLLAFHPSAHTNQAFLLWCPSSPAAHWICFLLFTPFHINFRVRRSVVYKILKPVNLAPVRCCQISPSLMLDYQTFLTRLSSCIVLPTHDCLIG